MIEISSYLIANVSEIKKSLIALRSHNIDINELLFHINFLSEGVLLRFCQYCDCTAVLKLAAVCDIQCNYTGLNMSIAEQNYSSVPLKLMKQ